jgi:hypothetical protein
VALKYFTRAFDNSMASIRGQSMNALFLEMFEEYK